MKQTRKQIGRKPLVEKDVQEITDTKQQLTEASFSGHTPMMQHYQGAKH
ncbi:hypothetical protein [Burkholderia gladioli]|nr:hypothetical protein [Burkholderia gladioli]